MVAKTFPYDNLLVMKDAGLVAADAAATVGGSAKIQDLGGGDIRNPVPLCEGNLIITTTAVEVADGDENYKVMLQGSNSASFASGIVNLAMADIGDAQVGGVDVVDPASGRYIVPWRNERNGTAFRYVRVYTDVTGTIATGINYTAALTVTVA